jgi:hypothetical protein
MNLSSSFFPLISFLLASCLTPLSQHQDSSAAAPKTSAGREYYVSVRFRIPGSRIESLEPPLSDDLEESLILEDSVSGQRLSGGYSVVDDKMTALIKARSGAAIRPRLIGSKFLEENPAQQPSTLDYEEGKKIIFFPVRLKTKTLAVKFANGSMVGTLARRYPKIFEELKEYAGRMLVLRKRGSVRDIAIDLQYEDGSVQIPVYLWQQRDRLVLALKSNDAASCRAVRLSGRVREPLTITLEAKEVRVNIIPLDAERKRFTRRDLPKIVIKHMDVELSGVVKQESTEFIASLVPEVRYQVGLTHRYYECPPWDGILAANIRDIKLKTTLTMDQYLIDLRPQGNFIEGRLPDSVLCTSRNNRQALVPLFRNRIEIPRLLQLTPPITIDLKETDAEGWNLHASPLQQKGRNTVTIQRELNHKARFSFRVGADDDLKGLRVKVSVSAEGFAPGWKDLQLVVNQTKRETIDWPKQPMPGDTISISMEKTNGINVSEDPQWQEAAFDTTVQWDGTSEIKLNAYKLPAFDVLYADLTQENIDRSTLLDQINGHLSASEGRADVKDCFLWISNGVDRSYGYLSRAREVVNDISRLEPLVQDFYNELRRLVDEFRTSYASIERVQPKYHLFLSQSSYNWIRADTQTLSKVMKELGLTEDQVVFYIYTARRSDKTLGPFTVVNLADVTR